MVKRIILSMAVLAVFSGELAASPADMEPASSIRNVVVYPDSALIRKMSVFSLKSGQAVVRISGITPNMIDDSVQAGLSGGDGVKIVDVKVEKTHLVKARREKAEALKSRLEHLDERIKATANEITVLTSANDLLKKIVPFPQNQKVTPAEVDAHVRFFAKSLSENYELIAKSESGLKKLGEEKKAVERELKNLGSLREESKSIVVFLFAQSDCPRIEMNFSYLVSGTGWTPGYDVRADSGGNVVLDCRATLSQSTGEDWRDIRMEISTARPSVYGAPPELPPWYVDVYQPRPVVAKAAPRRDADDLRPLMMERRNEAAQEGGYERAEVKTETSSFSFVLPRKVDVPSDNRPHKILIASAGGDATFGYYGVPKLSPYAYLRADLKNPFPFPLIEGPMSVFLDDRLVGTSSVSKTVLPGEDMNLPLGVDEGIRMEKKLVRKFTESAGAFSREIRVHYEYDLDIANGKGREILLTLKDHVPVSRNEKIKVEIESPRKEEANLSESGMLVWNLKLAGGEKKTPKIKFSVAYPKDARITGLE